MSGARDNTMRTSFVKGLTFLLAAGLLCGAVVITTGCQQTDTTEFAVETLAMSVGYELRNKFVWTDTAERYYNAIMLGQVSLDGAQAAEAYLRTVTHPLIANRLVRLAGMVGFNTDALGHVVGVDNVNIRYLQMAASGFRQGLLLAGPDATLGGVSREWENVVAREGTVDIRDLGPGWKDIIEHMFYQ